MGEQLRMVVRSNVKVNVQETGKDVRFSEDFFDVLDIYVGRLVGEAIHRAEANGRKTLKGADL